MPKKKKTAKSKPKKVDNSYVIKDANFGALEIRHSDNAWWIDKTKVLEYIRGRKLDLTREECRFLAGITLKQERYFREEHPELWPIIEAMNSMPSIKAQEVVAESIKNGNTHDAKWFLERRKPERFKERKDVTSDDKPILVDDLMD